MLEPISWVVLGGVAVLSSSRGQRAVRYIGDQSTRLVGSALAGGMKLIPASVHQVTQSALNFIGAQDLLSAYQSYVTVKVLENSAEQVQNLFFAQDEDTAEAALRNLALSSTYLTLPSNIASVARIAIQLGERTSALQAPSHYINALSSLLGQELVNNFQQHFITSTLGTIDMLRHQQIRGYSYSARTNSDYAYSSSGDTVDNSIMDSQTALVDLNRDENIFQTPLISRHDIYLGTESNSNLGLSNHIFVKSSIVGEEEISYLKLGNRIEERSIYDPEAVDLFYRSNSGVSRLEEMSDFIMMEVIRLAYPEIGIRKGLLGGKREEGETDEEYFKRISRLRKTELDDEDRIFLRNNRPGDTVMEFAEDTIARPSLRQIRAKFYPDIDRKIERKNDKVGSSTIVKKIKKIDKKPKKKTIATGKLNFISQYYPKKYETLCGPISAFTALKALGEDINVEGNEQKDVLNFIEDNELSRYIRYNGVVNIQGDIEDIEDIKDIEDISEIFSEGKGTIFPGEILNEYGYNLNEFPMRKVVLENSQGFIIEVGEEEAISPKRLKEAMDEERIVAMVVSADESTNHVINLGKIEERGNNGRTRYIVTLHDPIGNKPKNIVYEPTYQVISQGNSQFPFLDDLPSGYDAIERFYFSSFIDENTSNMYQPRHSYQQLEEIRQLMKDIRENRKRITLTEEEILDLMKNFSNSHPNLSSMQDKITFMDILDRLLNRQGNMNILNSQKGQIISKMIDEKITNKKKKIFKELGDILDSDLKMF